MDNSELRELARALLLEREREATPQRTVIVLCEAMHMATHYIREIRAETAVVDGDYMNRGRGRVVVGGVTYYTIPAGDAYQRLRGLWANELVVIGCVRPEIIMLAENRIRQK